MNTSLDLGLELFDGRSCSGGRGASQEGIDRFHGPVLNRIDGVPVNGNATRFHRIFQVVGRFGM